MNELAIARNAGTGADSRFQCHQWQRGPQVNVTVAPHRSGRRGRLDVTVDVRGSPDSLERAEYYINLYVSDLRSELAGWAPRNPITYPAVSSLKAPFTVTMGNLKCRRAYVGILVSVCNVFHREVDWSCRVYRTSDGIEARNCRIVDFVSGGQAVTGS